MRRHMLMSHEDLIELSRQQEEERANMKESQRREKVKVPMLKTLSLNTPQEDLPGTSVIRRMRAGEDLMDETPRTSRLTSRAANRLGPAVWKNEEGKSVEVGQFSKSEPIETIHL